MSFTEEQLRAFINEDETELDKQTALEIAQELQKRRDFLVTPNCCDAIQSSRIVFLKADYETCIYSERDENDPIPAPKWVSKRRRFEIDDYGMVEVFYCPLCGNKLPEITPVEPPGPIVSCTDSGYYCDICDKRLSSCVCYPLEAAWGIKNE